jgi:Na+-driven multidrug efflux pump
MMLSIVFLFSASIIVFLIIEVDGFSSSLSSLSSWRQMHRDDPVWDHSWQKQPPKQRPRTTHLLLPRIQHRRHFQLTATASSTDEELESIDPTQKINYNINKNIQDDYDIDIQNLPIPSYRQLLLFSGTTVLIWLSEPLLSLVDMTIVGSMSRTSSSSVRQLASLGPATVLFDGLLYMTYFLNVATTNTVASQRPTTMTNHNNSNNATVATTTSMTNQTTTNTNHNMHALLRTTSHIWTLGLLLGGLVTLISWFAAPTILQSMIAQQPRTTATIPSNNIPTQELISLASSYVWIRGCASVAAVLNGIWQAFCLANLDIVTPIRAVVAASLVNIVGDVAFVPRYGVAGAATATAMSTIVAATILGKKAKTIIQNWKQQQHQPQQIVNTLQQETERTTISRNSTTNNNSTQSSSTSFLLSNTSPHTPPSTTSIPTPPSYWSWPDQKSATQLFTMAGPIFFVLVAKIVCYGAMTIKCTEFDVQALAAHSLWMRIFYFFACFGDSLSQTAQAFLPATLIHTRYSSSSSAHHDHNKDQKNGSFQKVFRKLLWVALGLGIANSQISMVLLQRLGHFLTNDRTIIEYMRAHHGSAGLMMGLSILLHPFIMLLEGTVIACRDFTSLLVIYTMTLGLHFGFLQYWSGSFAAVWRTLFLFQCTRLGLYAWRVRKSTKNALMTAIPTTTSP